MRIGINGLLASAEQSYRNAGVSRYTLTLLNALSAFDQANEYVFIMSEPQLFQQRARSPNTSIISAGWATRHAAGRVLWEHALLAGEARRQRLDRFHALVNVLPLRLSCPGLVTIHDLAFLRLPDCFRPARRAYQQFFARQSAQNASIVIAISEHTRQDVIECWGIPAERIRVIPPILEECFTQPCPGEALSAFRARLGFPEPYILYLGTLEPRKNISRLLDAYALLKRETALPHRLVLAGARGWYYQTLEQRVRDLGLQQHVHFIGYVVEEEKPLWYHAADLFVYPSRYEGFGLPVAEAMACGVPVVTSNVSSLPELVGDNARFGAQAALTVAPDDTEALAHAVQQGLGDTILRQRLRERGLARVQRLSAGRIVPDILQAYQDAAQPRT